MTTIDTAESLPATRRLPFAISRKHLLVLGLLAAGIGAATYGHRWWTVGRFIESTDDAYVGGDITVLAPRVPGLIAEVRITDNQQVKAGDLLIRLDDRDYRAALAKAEATVAGEQATIANLEAQRALQDAVIAQAKAGITAADAETFRAQSDSVRYQQLVRTAAASVQSSQRADSDFKQARANGEKTRAAVDAAERQLDVIATQKQRAAAALAVAIAQRDIAQLDLGYTELRAPIDGTVGNRSARAGSYATVGAQLVSIVPSHGLWVDANFKENQLAHMQPGQSATIAADVLSGRTFHGHVLSLAPATGAQFSILPAENATGNFTKIVQRVPVRILLDGGAATLGVLRPGLSVTAEIDQRDPARAGQ